MALTRRYLKELGLEAEQIDKIMESYGATVAEHITKSEAEEATKKAIEEAKKAWEASQPKPTKVEDSEEYKALLGKYSDLELNTQLTGAKVKDKYRDFVKSKLDKDKPFDEAINAVKTEYAEFFEGDNKPAGTNKPIFTEPNNLKPTEDKTEEQKILEDFKKSFMR